MEKINKPWGYYEVLLSEIYYKVKRIVVFPGKRLSLQSHNYRKEDWTCVQGSGTFDLEMFHLEKGEKEPKITNLPLVKGQYVGIYPGKKHRLSNLNGTEDLIIIETQHGEECSEEDIVRYEDDYNRTQNS